MFIEFLFLLNPLLISTYSFPTIIDRLFISGYPQPENLRSINEEKFACLFKTNEILEKKYKLQVR